MCSFFEYKNVFEVNVKGMSGCNCRFRKKWKRKKVENIDIFQYIDKF